MTPLDFIKSVVSGASRSIPEPARRFAGQVFEKIPVSINPLRTRQPTTTLGRIGKEINPLNPRNVAILAATEAARAIAGKTLDPQGQARVEYMTFGPQIGTFLNILDAGSAGAAPARERQLIEESQRYFAQQALQNKTQAAPAKAGPRIDEATTQSQYHTTVPVQSARVIPATLTEPPAKPPVTPQAIAAAQTGFAAPGTVPLGQFYAAQEQIGGEMARTGELQRQLQEAGLTGEGLAEWAKANPTLAYREIMRRQKQPAPSVD